MFILAFLTPEQMLFNRCLVSRRAEVVALKILFRNVVHAYAVRCGRR